MKIKSLNLKKIKFPKKWTEPINSGLFFLVVELPGRGPDQDEDNVENRAGLSSFHVMYL